MREISSLEVVYRRVYVISTLEFDKLLVKFAEISDRDQLRACVEGDVSSCVQLVSRHGLDCYVTLLELVFREVRPGVYLAEIVDLVADEKTQLVVETEKFDENTVRSVLDYVKSRIEDLAVFLEPAEKYYDFTLDVLLSYLKSIIGQTS